MLTKLSLYQFKNYDQRDFNFDKNICCFYGQNGAGKTNILDAIYYLCFTKSYFSSYDHQVTMRDKQGMYVKGQFDSDQVDCIIRENNKKEISLNGNIYDRNAEHIGTFPAVIISPDDTILINGYGDVRRRLMDILLSQLNTHYLQELIRYNKYLAQRNALLKSAKSKVIDAGLHDHYKDKMCEHGRYIYEERTKLVNRLQPQIKELYKSIAQTSEEVNISYRSQLQQSTFKELLAENAEKDFFTQRSNVGIHKDDIDFTINDLPLKSHASQGQKKSFLFAFKLAEYNLLKESTTKNPILLLDDIFEKLDEERSQFLVNMITELKTQIFVTDTHEQRLRKAFDHKKLDVQYEAIK